MKAISIKEPWATKIYSGEKTIETRTWKTKYRGDLLLCASLNPKSDLSGYGFAIAKLTDIQPMIKNDEKFACCEYYPGAYSWFLSDVKIITLIKIKGQLGLFNVDLK